MINFIGNFDVIPSLPENLEPLREIAYNLYWSWNQDAQELFRRLDRELWEATHHNPVLMLGQISQDELKNASRDSGFVSHMNRVYLQLTVYMQEITWYQKNFDSHDTPFVAYFSAEFGLTECLQIYSGGLGVLSGDHLKSASDLGVPLAALGLCYKEGYFQQYLTSDGWQQERYELTDFQNQPMTLVLDENNIPIKITLDFPDRKVSFQIWKIQVGRVPLYLLDTNVAENSDTDKWITRSLYGGNKETRIEQEIILGIGGIRALHALGVNPSVCHMNEGHSAFLALERIKYLIDKGLSFREAKDIGFYSNIFTTHTPVPAGIDVFDNQLVEKYLGNYYRKELKISDKEFYSLGTIIKDKPSVNFNMAHLAMNMAGFVNGVSKLHGKVSKKLWVDGFKNIPFDEIPIDYITNGIHTRSHLSNEMYELLFRYIGDNFSLEISENDIWSDIDEIPDEELWRTHERRRERLVTFARARLQEQVRKRGGSLAEIKAAKEVLNASALTIGFARRFATYKRANLILRDIERLANILGNNDLPVQFIIAGKAHPQDDAGKKLIQEIVAAAKEEHFRKKIVFIENYDMNIARYMVEGCDVWLNNPRRPLEASGTSGMKIIANGGLNFSVLDGWWDEAFDPMYGWKIGNGEEYMDLEYQDEIESRLIYDTLENEIIPTFFDRGDDKIPRGWIAMMKASMKNLGPVFNTHRMVEQYTTKYYLNAYKKRLYLKDNDFEKTREFSVWKSKLLASWSQIKFIKTEVLESENKVKVNSKYSLSAEVFLGDLKPQDIEVQIYYGKVDQWEDTSNNFVITMDYVSTDEKANTHKFIGEIVCEITGHFGFTFRILPKHELLINPFELSVIHWA